MLCVTPPVSPWPRVVHETKGLLFVDKPAGLSFHASAELNDPGIMPILRQMCLSGEISHDGRLFSVHRLDRVTSGLLMVAKTPEAAADAAELLRERQLHKYYVALSGRKPSKKMGTVRGDMERSRRGQYKLLRSTHRPAVTTFVSEGIVLDGAAEEEALTAVRRAFVLKPLTGRTHQLRVALKSLGSPVLGDPMYAASADAAKEERAYLHAAALRLPPNRRALSEDGAPIDVVCMPTEGAAFQADAFVACWRRWFGDAMLRAPAGTSEWFAGTTVASRAWAGV